MSMVGRSAGTATTEYGQIAITRKIKWYKITDDNSDMKCDKTTQITS